MIMLLLFAGVSTANAQPSPIGASCLESSIRLPGSGSWGGYIPYCMDTLIVERRNTLPPSGALGVGLCAELFEVHMEGGQRLRRRVSTTNLCDNPEYIMVVPHEKLQAQFALDSVRIYELHMYCQYWLGADRDDTSVIEFQVARGFNAYAQAIDEETGKEITGGQLVEPTKDHRSYLNTGEFRLNAWDGFGYTFQRWKCDVPGVPLDASSRSQTLDFRCWPINTTTVFTAEYRRLLSDVGAHFEQHVEIRQQGSKLLVRRPSDNPATLMLFDVTGQTIYHEQIHDSTTELSLGTLPCGVYLCTIVGEHAPTTSIIHYTEETK
jgi:hypothetical protein